MGREKGESWKGGKEEDVVGCRRGIEAKEDT